MPASCVTVQVGQCGNQLGAKLLDRLARDFADEAEADYFFRAPADPKHPHRVARSVLVDTEPRALGAARGGARKGRRWAYGGRSRVCCGQAAVVERAFVPLHTRQLRGVVRRRGLLRVVPQLALHLA